MKIKNINLKNLRSFEDCLIEFEDFYTAICRKNNSGKSNIIRAILNVLEKFIPSRNRLNFNSDFPVWKSKSSKENIELTVRIQLDSSSDIGLIKFLQVIKVYDILLAIIITIGANPKENKTEILVNDKSLDDNYKIGEILRRIHFAQFIVFHTSTQPNTPYRRSSHGQLENLSIKTKESIENKVTQINKELSKAIQKHKSELQELIGRLQEKYEVGLSFSGLNLRQNLLFY